MMRLRQLRKQRELTMEQLGDKVGVTGATISNYENEKRQPSNKMLKTLAEFFGVTTDYLLGEADDPVEDIAIASTTFDSKNEPSKRETGKLSSGLALHFLKDTPYDELTDAQKRAVHKFAVDVLESEYSGGTQK